MTLEGESSTRSWIHPVMKFIETGELPKDQNEASLVKRRAPSHTIVAGQLYKRGFSTPLLKCIEGEEAAYALEEVHEGIAGQHLGGRALAKKVLRAGFYWPTMVTDAKNFVKVCEKCQKYGDVHNSPPAELHSLTIPWPFRQWGLDILGAFPMAAGQLKFLIVAVDYCCGFFETYPTTVDFFIFKRRGKNRKPKEILRYGG
jgi:hypothetical protein